MTRLLCAALALAACGPPSPPAFYSIDSEFSGPERETIRSTVDAWCESDARWCPEEIGWAEHGAFVLVGDLEERSVCASLDGCVTGGRNTGDGRVLIARNRHEADNLDALWLIAAHEAGHYCKDGHTKTGLMAAVHTPADALEIDDEAVRAWREGCGL